MEEMTLKILYDFLWNLSILNLIQYYIFVFILFSLIKFLLRIEIDVLKFEIYNRRVLVGSILTYFFLKSKVLVNYVDINFEQGFSFLVFASLVLFILLIFYRLILEKFIAPILITVILVTKLFSSHRGQGNKVRHLHQYRFNFKPLILRVREYLQETMDYVKVISINLLASCILVHESSILHIQLGVITSIYCLFFVFYSWKAARLEWTGKIGVLAAYNEIIYKAEKYKTP